MYRSFLRLLSFSLHQVAKGEKTKPSAVLHYLFHILENETVQAGHDALQRCL